MDDMQIYELADMIDNIPYTDRNGWEQSRIISYYIAQKMVKKKINIKDIIPFVWDKKDIDEELNMKQIEINKKKLEYILNNGK
mgnify:CR=1 FL=1